MKIVDIKKIYGDYIITLQIFSETYTFEFMRDFQGVWWIVRPGSIYPRSYAADKEWTEKLEKLYQEYKT